MSPQAGWLLQEQIIPRLRTSIPKTVRCVGAEDAEELVQDATVMAARLLMNAEKAGKQVTAGNIVHYTGLHMRSGRRSTGTQTVDVLGTAAQLNGSSRTHSLHEVVAQVEGEEIFELHDILSTDHEDPSIQAARKMDWDSFVSGLSKVEIIIVEFLCAGKTMQQMARKARLSVSTIQYHRNRIAGKILEFFGADILKQITRLPHWKINLDAEREMVLCRHERRPA